jgi:hypothetical protein
MTFETLRDKSLTEAETRRSETPLPPVEVVERTQISHSSRNESRTPTDLGESVPNVGRRLLSNGGEGPVSPSVSLHWSISPQSIHSHFSPGSSQPAISHRWLMYSRRPKTHDERLSPISISPDTRGSLSILPPGSQKEQRRRRQRLSGADHRS